MSQLFKIMCCLLYLCLILCLVEIDRMPIAVFPGVNYNARSANNSYLIINVSSNASKANNSYLIVNGSSNARNANNSYLKVNVSSNASSRDDYELSLFAEVFTAVEAQLFDRTIGVLTTALRRANVTFFLNGGTLLGSYRHHGRIPRDYEADLIVEAGQRQRALDELNRCCVREFVVWKHDSNNSRMHFKFFPTAGQQVPGKHYRKPFIDIFSYAMNATHVWNESPWFPDDRYLRRDVFPLRERPFGDLMLPAPCNTASALADSYKVSECMQRNPTVVRQCTDRRLRDLHPFVTRSRWKAANGRMMVNETLVVGNRTLHEVKLSDECNVQDK